MPAPASTEPLQIPENAYRELRPGEVYRPVITPDKVLRTEITVRSIVFGPKYWRCNLQTTFSELRMNYGNKWGNYCSFIQRRNSWYCLVDK